MFITHTHTAAAAAAVALKDLLLQRLALMPLGPSIIKTSRVQLLRNNSEEDVRAAQVCVGGSAWVWINGTHTGHRGICI